MYVYVFVCMYLLSREMTHACGKHRTSGQEKKNHEYMKPDQHYPCRSPTQMTEPPHAEISGVGGLLPR